MNIEEAKKKLLEPQKISLIEIIRKFKREGIENFVITRPEIVETLLTAYEKEKEKNKKIDEFCRKELAFERRLKRENREPDEFNQGRFYVSENIRKIIEEE